MSLYADYKGHKAALMTSVILMCFGSRVIALTPGYETIGVGTPILLILARLLQGLPVDVKYGTSATYPQRDGHQGTSRLLFQLPVCNAICGQFIALGMLIALQRVLATEALYT